MKVAVVGSGLAGLVAAYSLAPVAEVHIYEKGDKIGVHGASLDYKGDTIDAPMRSFAGGYYRELRRLCHDLHVPLKRTFYAYNFASPKGIDFRLYGKGGLNGFWGRGLWHTFVVALAYIYFSILALIFTFLYPCPDQSIGEFCHSFRIPLSFVKLLCITFSAVTGTSHTQAMTLPASDVLSYKARTMFRPHYVMRWGIASLCRKLLRENITVHLNEGAVFVTSGVLTTQKGDVRKSEAFDHIIMATPPACASHIIDDIECVKLLTQIPTQLLQVLTHTSRHPQLMTTSPLGINFMSYEDHTVSTQAITNELCQTSSGLGLDLPIRPDDVIAKSVFIRTLRNGPSRSVTKRIQAVNGRGGVWFVGSWVWDGLVLLEGCAVSALKVAEAIKHVHQQSASTHIEN